MRFAVFFSDPLAHGIELVEAATAAQALLQAELDHQGGRLGVVPAEQLDGCDHHRLLMGWIALEGAQEGREEVVEGPGVPWRPSRQQRR
jgi:hypothetical protein